MLSSLIHSEVPKARPSLQYYVMFVVLLTTVETLLFVWAPLAVMDYLHQCDNVTCLSMQRDLERSVDPKVDPCYSFYSYVCSLWGRRVGAAHVSPMHKYDSYISKFLLRNFVLRSMKERRQKQTVRDKATTLLVKCGQHASQESDMTEFLRSLKLPWPERSHTSRLDILDILVGSSLDHGVPALWSFMVGRHPGRPRENILYLSVDHQIAQWIRHVEKLRASGNVEQFFRACAEKVGGTGQSYDRMITDVLSVHEDIRTTIETQMGVYRPEYINLSDVQLRIAVNRHLPDSSQLWPEDEILCLQRGVFEYFDIRYLKNSSARVHVKLYIGAYLVWFLTPLTSYYLTNLLVEGMGSTLNVDAYKMSRCFDALLRVMPLVVWKTNMDTLRASEKEAAFDVFRSLGTAIDNHVRPLSPNAADDITELLSSLTLNAYNLSIPWEKLERAYAMIPPLEGNFFAMYLTVARKNAAVFKESMRKPNNDVLHIPGVASVVVYRLLICRELELKPVNIFPPVFQSSGPAPFKLATLGVHMGTLLAHLFYFVYFLNDRFDQPSTEEIESSVFTAGIRKYFLTLSRHIEERLNRTGIRKEDRFYVVLHSIGLNFAYAALSTAGRRQASSVSSRQRFRSDQLFYLVGCFLHCHSQGPTKRDEALCNTAVTQVHGFANAFGCKPGQPMYLDFPSKW